ncbi:MAG: hypothetical protein EAZ95_18030 [Bacteroidetes bacterium]|nr:MAG: hypothetical protein EAZ95_18030 [Bacteroidota bacterium]
MVTKFCVKKVLFFVTFVLFLYIFASPKHKNSLMGLFQKSVFNNFVQRFAYNAETELKDAFVRFQARFQTSNVQAKILASKEELYQRTFLREFFEEVLGYTHHPKDNHNLEVEKKNPHDAHKVDGVLLKDQHVRVVIELKSTKTHLDTVVEQAFSYLNAHKHAKYVITSNFTHLRFYLDKKDEFEEFDLFNLAYEDFERMYALLCPATILSDAIDRLNQASIAKEEDITKDFYEKYQNFKDALCLNMSVNNKQIDKLLLFEKAQKLLDRIIFMYFASSKGLLPTNHVDVIIKEWSDLVKMRIGGTLFDRFKAHFEFINSGFTSEKYEIYAYNGGLFAKDAVLDKLKIDNDILVYHCGALLQYDYVSEVDVNILGHIFEHSLSQADQKKQEILQKMQDLEAGKDVKIDNQRKVDGIFYTPSYITNYMVEETLGKLCADKKETLGLTTATEQIDLPALTAYKQWLETVSVLDPACGSGAFLNQVLSFFIKEFNWIETLEMSAIGKKGKRGTYINTILDNNIFGVDLNQESVAITKLSLGNSLISDTTLHEKAFDWAKEFPKVMKNGGFTLIVGNPPYGAHLTDKIKKHLQKTKPLVPDFESYYYFIDKGLELLRPEGKISYIIPNTFLSNQFAQKFRANLLENHTVMALSDLSAMEVFDEAKVRTCIFVIDKEKKSLLTKFSTYLREQNQINTDKYLNESYLSENLGNWLTLFTISTEIYSILKKIRSKAQELGDFCEVSQGLIPYDKYRGHDEETIKNRIWHASTPKDSTYKKELKGADVNQYFCEWNGELWVSYGKWLAAPRDPKFFTQPRLLIREIAEYTLIATYLEGELYNTGSLINVIQKDANISLKYILAILNSKMMGWYHHNTSPKAKKGLFPKILIADVRKIPIPYISAQDQQVFVAKVERLIDLKRQIFKSEKDMTDLLEGRFGVGKFGKKLADWYKGHWKDFLAILTKAKVGLTISQELEWKNFFEDEKQKTLPIAQEAQILENEIDTLVYALYDLSLEEIRLIENE